MKYESKIIGNLANMKNFQISKYESNDNTIWRKRLNVEHENQEA